MNKELYCVDCGHNKKDHVQLHKVTRRPYGLLQLWKCWKCPCRELEPVFSSNGNTWNK